MQKYIDRFNSKVDIRGPNDCWNWTAYKIPTGYGQYWADGTMKSSHRIAWEIANGPIPDGMFVCHKCDNKTCVNPNHLFLGSHQDNMKDRNSKGRQAKLTGILNGQSKLTEEQVLAIRSFYATGSYTQTELGERFGVSHQQIGYIVNRKLWTHI